MLCSPEPSGRINSFALVSYIPNPLGAFLDELRRDLVAGCEARCHVTILPPRTLEVSAEEGAAQLHSSLRDVPHFQVELTGIEVFESTSVIYVGVGLGAAELESIHSALNRGGLGFDEPYTFHPHVTLAQNIGADEVPELRRLAEHRWRSFTGARRYEIDVLTFVQNTAANRWLDLEEFPLARPVGQFAG